MSVGVGWKWKWKDGGLNTSQNIVRNRNSIERDLVLCCVGYRKDDESSRMNRNRNRNRKRKRNRNRNGRNE